MGRLSLSNLTAFFENKKYEILIFSVLLLLFEFLFFNLSFTDGDEGRYLILAESHAQGLGQVELQHPDVPVEAFTPPIYPWLLGQCIKVTHYNPWILKGFSAGCYFLASIILFVLLKRVTGYKGLNQLSLCCLALLGVFPMIYTWAIFSETLYILSTTLVFFLITGRHQSAKFIAAAAAMTAISMMIRPVGLALVPAIGAYLFFRKNYKGLGIFIGIFLIFYGPFILHTYKTLGVPFAYITHYSDETQLNQNFISSILGKFKTVFTALPYFIFDGLPRQLFFSLFDGDCLLCKLRLNFLSVPLKVAIGSLSLIGLFLRIKKWEAFDWYIVVYFTLISTYEIGVQRGIEDRLILPALPLIAIYIFTAIQFICSKINKNSIAPVLFKLAAVYVILTTSIAGIIHFKAERPLIQYGFMSSERHINHPSEARKAWGRYIESAEWLKENSPENAIVLSRKPKQTYLLSQRKSFRLANYKEGNESAWETFSKLDFKEPVYILQDAYPLSSSYGLDRSLTVDKFLSEHSNHFELLHTTSSPETHIWAYKKIVKASQ